MFDGRIQVNGEAGILNYLLGTSLVNPHLTLHYRLPEQEWQKSPRVTSTLPVIPEATEPHPHTMKLGEFIAHSHLFGKVKVSGWLKKGFSRISDQVMNEMAKEPKNGLAKGIFDKNVDQLADGDFTKLFTAIQNTELKPPSTTSVLSIGEDAMSKSIQRIGKVDFFSVVTRKPTICDFKPVQVEVAIARLEERASEGDSPVQVLRFANRVPLQFDKSACAIVQAITSVNWRAYGLGQPKDALPQGPYIFAVSVVSPFIKFKNASKETIDASDELVEEIRRTLMQAGQKLSRYIKAEDKANDLEEKIRYIEQFGPILVEGLARITSAKEDQKIRAREGLMKILGRDANEAKNQVSEANRKLEIQKSKDVTEEEVEE